MASANAGPITGKERIRIIQGGWDTWIDRAQFTSLLALPSLPNVGPRPYTTPTAILGTETISAWQDGAKITLNAGDITTYLAGSGTAPPHPDPNLATTFTGNELIMGHQSGWRVAWGLSEVSQILTGGSGYGVFFDFSRSIYQLDGRVAASPYLIPGFAFSRASVAWAPKLDGSLQRFAVDQLRRTDAGALLEAAATNLFISPDDLANAAWTKSNIGVVGGQPAPDGTNTAFLLTDATAAAFSNIGQSVAHPGDLTRRAISLWVLKAPPGTQRMGLTLQFTGGTAETFTNRFEPDTGIFTNSAPSTFNVEDRGLWWRIWLAPAIANTSHTAMNTIIYPATSPNGSTVDAAATVGSVTVWMPQVEAGAFPSSPAVGSRAADVASIALPVGAPTDVITFKYSGGSITSQRGALNTIDFGASSGGAWLGKSLQLISLINAVGALNETRFAVRQQIMSSVGQPGNLSPSASPVFSFSGDGSSSGITGTLTPWTNSAFRWLSGEIGVAGIAFPDTICGRQRNVTYSADGTNYAAAMGGVLEFIHTGTLFEVEFKVFAGIAMRVLVDGQISGNAVPSSPTSVGGLTYMKVDFSGLSASPVARKIRIEGGPLYLVGIKILAGETITAPTDPVGLRIVIGGDSYTEGTGASPSQNGFAAYTSRALGFKDYWPSGSGGTGWWQTLASPPRVNFTDRFDRDITTPAADVLVVAMGYNDLGDGNDAVIQTAATAKLTAYRAAHPKTLMYIVGAWSVDGAGSQSGYPGMKAILQGIANAITGCVFIDMQNVSYTKIGDGIHPDNAGHATISNFIGSAIATDVGA